MKRISMLLLLVALTVAAGCALFHPVAPPEKNAEAYELLMESWFSPSRVRKIQLRAQLVKEYPETASGMFSRAWLAAQDGDEEQSKEDYKNCLKRYPDFMPAMWNHNFNLEEENKRAMREKMMRTDPRFYSGTVVRLLYDLEEDLSEEALEKFIARWNNTLPEDHYVFDFIRALNRQYEHKNYREAAEYYEKALATPEGLTNFEVWERYLNLRFNELADPERSDGDEFSVLESAMSRIQSADIPEVQKGQFIHKCYVYVAKKAEKLSERLAINLYQKANEAYFSAEVVEKIYEAYWKGMKRQDAIDFMLENVKKHPTNYKVLEGLAVLYARQQNYKLSEEYYLRALENAHTVESLLRTTDYYCDDVLYPNFRVDEAYSRLKKYENTRIKQGLYRNAMVKNRLLASDYSGARSLIDTTFEDLEKRGATPNDYTKDLRRLIEMFVDRSKLQGDLAVIGESPMPGSVISTQGQVKTNWVTVSPDQKYFFANSGNGGDYSLWDAENFIALKTIEKFLPVGSHIVQKERIRPIFSPNGKLIAFANSFSIFGGEVVVFEVASGRLVSQRMLPRTVLGIAWNPLCNDEIAVLMNGGLARIDVLDNTLKHFVPIEKHVAGGGFVWTADGKELAFSEKYEAGEVRVFDAETLKQTLVLSDADWPHALGATADGRYLLCADNNRYLHVWDRQNDWAHRRLKINTLVNQIAPHPVKPRVVLNDWGRSKGRNLAELVDVEDLKTQALVEVGGSNLNYSFIDGGKKVLLADYHEDELCILDGETLRLVQTYRNDAPSKSSGIHAVPQLDLLVFWDGEGIHLWDVTAGKMRHAWPGDYQSVASHPEEPGKLIALMKTEDRASTIVYRFDLETLVREEVMQLDIAVDRWGVQGGDLLVAGTPYVAEEWGSDYGVLRLYDLTTAIMQAELIVGMVTEERNYDRLSYSRFKDLEISPDNNTVAFFTEWGDGWRQDKKVSALTRVFSLVSSEELRRFERVGGLAFKDNEHLVIADKGSIEEGAPYFDLHDGNRAGMLGKEMPDTRIGRHQWLGSSAEFPSQNLKAQIYDGNRIEFSDLEKGNLVLTLLAKRGNEWIAYTPEGDFNASPHGTDEVFRLTADGKVPLATVREEYERPQRLREKLAEVARAPQSVQKEAGQISE